MDEPFAITLDVGSSLANHTGTWRTERPVYLDRTPPCTAACPAGEVVQRWLYDAEDGGYESAWRMIMAANPFPAITGRVCYHPCESACNRGELDTVVGIQSVERFLGDEAVRVGWVPDPVAAPTGRRVLVVGAGPSGLSAAHQLARRGHAVTVRDAQPLPGGMMRYGIPAYRLPRAVLDGEIARLLAQGIALETGTTVDDVAAAAREFDAVYLAVGAQLGHRTTIPAGDGARVLDALALLHDVAAGEPPALGRRVVVYGGGNTAFDAARSARRLGATDPLVVYRRTRDRMPAHDAELAQAIEEGVTVRWLSTVTHTDAETVTVERMELDDTGFPQPTGEFDELAADTLVLALGQDVDSSALTGVPGIVDAHGLLRTGPDFATTVPGVFAGGDAVAGERTVTAAIGHGAQAARHIDAYLRATAYQPPPKPLPATFDLLNPVYYSDAPATVRSRLELARRVSTFDEVEAGLDADTAQFEARRCMSCGTCFECDNCYGMCPDNAITKLGPGLRFAIDYDYCKGCGICVAECPAGAITMQPEER
ncbi:NAD(P)-binding protein [Pseudonocardia sp. GCM10023141]|uniref:NAD(P)-binding protein n=1 Tax=Pseudonocardia sp. GCM10023141 TaxID=3252653 RepID=UPI00361B1151